MLQKKVGGSWINVGVPAQRGKHDAADIRGRASAGFAHGTYRTRATGKVLLYGSQVWQQVVAAGPSRTF